MMFVAFRSFSPRVVQSHTVCHQAKYPNPWQSLPRRDHQDRCCHDMPTRVACNHNQRTMRPFAPSFHPTITLEFPPRLALPVAWGWILT